MKKRIIEGNIKDTAMIIKKKNVHIKPMPV